MATHSRQINQIHFHRVPTKISKKNNFVTFPEKNIFQGIPDPVGNFWLKEISSIFKTISLKFINWQWISFGSGIGLHVQCAKPHKMNWRSHSPEKYNFNGLVQDCNIIISIDKALDVLQSYTKPSICSLSYQQIIRDHYHLIMVSSSLPGQKSTLCRQHFQMHFHEWKILYFDPNFVLKGVIDN